jgi:mycofactocin glycosyltransferase
MAAMREHERRRHASGTAEALPPPSFSVRIAPDTLIREEGKLLVGGAPGRLVRLSQRGAQLVSGWNSGNAIGDEPGARRLARRLLDAQLVIPSPHPVARLEDIVIVIPVRDTPLQLDRCLGAVRRTAPGIELVVVDDGSRDGHRIADVAASHDVRVIRRAHPGGAAAARNSGIAATNQPLIGFVDADVVVESGCFERLCAHFADPRTGAVAPRVLALDAVGSIGRYEAHWSSLDMGRRPAVVGPGQPVSYVPTATLAMRRAALPPGDFDATLSVGEDVELVWQMHANGWRVIYDPVAVVRHEHRTRPGAAVRRRLDYARSIGPLARRHPEAIQALTADPLTAATLIFAVARRPLPTVALMGVRLIRTRRALLPHTGAPNRLAVSLTGRLLRGALDSTSHATRRAWLPLLLLFWQRRAAQLLILGAYGVRMLERDGPRRPDELALDIVSDAVAAAGTLMACVQHGTARPITPMLRRQMAPRRATSQRRRSPPSADRPWRGTKTEATPSGPLSDAVSADSSSPGRK